MASIKLEQVQKAFGNVMAVNQLDLEIRDGEFFTFLGPSGCGKTTTLRMIAGFYYPTKGVVRFGDEDMTRVPPEKRNTGMVFQNYALFPHMTVFENVAFGLNVRKMPKKEVTSQVEEILRKVRLEKFSTRQVSQLSGGQQQRVALARALVIEPEILLLDEPLSNLDAKLREEMRSEILRLQKEYKITTIYVTHDQAEALSMSDRIAVFNEGVCHQVGTPNEIYNEPVNDFVASFIGEINLFPIQIEEMNEEHARVTTVAAASDLQKQLHLVIRNHPYNIPEKQLENLYLSIRPEALKLLHQKVDGENVFKGVVEEVSFFGSVIHVILRIDGLKVQVHLLNHQVSETVVPGKEILVQLPADKIRLIRTVSGDVL